MTRISGYSLRNLQPDWKHGQPLKLAQGASGCDRLPHAGLSGSRHLLTPYLAHRRCAVESPSTPVARLVLFFAQGVTRTLNVAQHLDPYPSLFKQSIVSKTFRLPGRGMLPQHIDSALPGRKTVVQAPACHPAPTISFLMVGGCMRHSQAPASPSFSRCFGYRFSRFPKAEPSTSSKHFNRSLKTVGVAGGHCQIMLLSASDFSSWNFLPSFQPASRGVTHVFFAWGMTPVPTCRVHPPVPRQR